MDESELDSSMSQGDNLKDCANDECHEIESINFVNIYVLFFLNYFYNSINDICQNRFIY